MASREPSDGGEKTIHDRGLVMKYAPDLARFGNPEPVSSKTSPSPPPPKRLSARSRAWWRSIIGSQAFNSHRLLLLELAARALDRAGAADAVIEKEGTTYEDGRGTRRVRPDVRVRSIALREFQTLCGQAGVK
jgi:hypothetical protein